MMNSNEVKILVEQDISGRWDETNHHHVDLRSSLVRPQKINVIKRVIEAGKIKDSVIEVWLILEEKAETKDGYKIIFDEKTRDYGLASNGWPSDQHLSLVGFYGGFWDAFKGM